MRSFVKILDNFFCLCSLLVRDVEIGAYIWLHKNYCIYELPWNSPWTWLLSMMGVDFCYYWVHRYSHGLQANCFGCQQLLLYDCNHIITENVGWTVCPAPVVELFS